MRDLKSAFCVSVLILLSARGVQATQKMNLLIIETDEHHFKTLGCYGGTIVGTPNIDRIAREGALCTAFYANTPVCSPSRAALVSGLYPQRAGVTTNNMRLADSVVTFAELLRRRGYATGYAGKWHLDGNGKPQWAPRRQFGFADNRFMFNRGHWKKLIDTPDGPRVGAKDRRGRPSYGLNGADEKTFTTDWLCDKAVDFIHANKDRPFCYMVNLPDPHGPNTVRAPYDTMFENVKVPIPASLVRTPEQIPAWGKPARVTKQKLIRLMRNYYGMVRCIDDNVGKLLRTLEETGLADRTIVVFTSDHGDLCGEHGRLNKGVPYEGSARIPFLIRCPRKIKPNTKVDITLSNVDFLPTVMHLMDIADVKRTDGRNAAGWLTGHPPENWQDVTFLRSTGRPGANGPAWLAAVTRRYKLVFSTNDSPWLFDMENDPHELTNLFGDAQLKPGVERLTRALREYAAANDDEFVGYAGIRQWIAQVLDGE